MIVGCPKEIKDMEGRVGLTPGAVHELGRRGHTVLVEVGAGLGSGIPDEEYLNAGAQMVRGSAVFREAEMLVKVKEPLPEEYGLLREGQVLFTYLHLAAGKELTEHLLERQVIGIGYETVEIPDGSLPLLAPMSVIAGRLAPQVGAQCLQSNYGGKGVLLGGVPGTLPAEVVILGAGNVGVNAAKIAAGMGARVTVMGISQEMSRLDYIGNIFGGRVDTAVMDARSIPHMVERADLVICGVLVKGARSPKLITREMVKTMRPGSALVDVSVDQGGCCETTHPTTHSHPTYEVDGIIHYAVTNMPGIVARTSTFALTNATLPYVLKLADQGYRKALLADEALQKGLNVYYGKLTNKAVADSLGREYTTFAAVSGGAASIFK